MTIHKPVLLNEVIEYLNLHPGDKAIDATFGGGGHGAKILEKILPTGKLLAIDLDKDILKNFDVRAVKNLTFINDNFKNLKEIVEKNFINHPVPTTSGHPSLKSRGLKVQGILFDLGLSSDELENSGRGFSFQKDEPLDMRFDTEQTLTAQHILNSYSLEDLYDIFKNLGEYPHARQLSKIIFKQRKLKKFKTTFDLVAAVLQVHRRRQHDGAKFYRATRKIHPATKVFQALRIAVNNELENLKEVLPQAVEILAPSGRLVVISFQALEDRIVKNYFRSLVRVEKPSQGLGIKLLTKKPISPSEKEIENNPRSRSAKMRVIEKL